MVQTEQGLLAAVPLYEELGAMSEKIWGRDSLNLAQVQHALSQAYATTGAFAESLPYMKEALRIFQVLLPADAKEITEATTFIQVVGDQIAREGAERQALEDRLKQKKVPKISSAGKENMRAKLASSVGASPIASGSGTKAGVAIPSDTPAIKEHGQKANLSVDELVNFIQGKPSSSKASSKSSSTSRKRKVSPPATA